MWLNRPEFGNDDINEAAQLRRLPAIGMEEKMNGPSGGLVPWKHPNQPTRYEVIADHILRDVRDAGPR